MLSDPLNRCEFPESFPEMKSCTLDNKLACAHIDQVERQRGTSVHNFPQMYLLHPSESKLRIWMRLSKQLLGVIWYHTDSRSENRESKTQVVAFNSAIIKLTFLSTDLHEDDFERTVLRIYSKTVINPRFALVDFNGLHNDTRVLVYDLNDPDCYQKLEMWSKIAHPYTIQLSHIKENIRKKYNIVKPGIVRIHTHQIPVR